MELTYIGGYKVILFHCYWFDVGSKKTMQQYESDGVSLIVEANDEEDLQNQLSRKDADPEEVDEAVFQKVELGKEED